MRRNALLALAFAKPTLRYPPGQAFFPDRAGEALQAVELYPA